MPRSSDDENIVNDRRTFLTRAGVAAALAMQSTAAPAADNSVGGRTPPRDCAVAAGGRASSDFMVDVLRGLDLDYIAMNPGSSFDALQESIINYGGNTKPELLTCLHEESAAAMAHGYAKAAQKPMMVLLHGTVGLLHTSMAIFQARADRVPIFVVVAQERNPKTLVGRPHSAQDMGALARDFTKWDDEPTTLERFVESAVRAYQISVTPPMSPTLLVLNSELQQAPIRNGSAPRMPKALKAHLPQGEIGAIREAAQLLVTAERPLIRALKLGRTQQGWDALIELAELLQAPVSIDTLGAWHCFPSRHPLSGAGGANYTADVTLGLDMIDMSAAVNHARAHGGKTISIGTEALFCGSNIHDFGPWSEVDLPLIADAETTLPLLSEEIRRRLSTSRRRALAARGQRIANAHREEREHWIEEARFGWNSRPISVPRMIAELRAQIRHDDWAMVSGRMFTGDWQRRILNFDKHYRYVGDSGGFGVGYDTPASVGAALAHRQHGRISIAIVGDGDFNYVGPGVLWTAAHHRIPLLMIIHNNRAYHMEVMIMQGMMARRGRGAKNAHIGTTIADPNVDYATVARGYGVYAEGPIDKPDELGAAFSRALARVRAGEPALVDVVSQPR